MKCIIYITWSASLCVRWPRPWTPPSATQNDAAAAAAAAAAASASTSSPLRES